MNCPQCKSSQSKLARSRFVLKRRGVARQNGFRRGKQSYRCKDCGCQYVENPKPRGYPDEIKQLCLKMYLNGMGFRAIARVTEIDHATIINWVKEKGEKLSDDPQDEEIPQRGDGGQLDLKSSFRAPEITEIDELRTFVGCKKNKFWVWTVVNHKQKGILLWNIGDHAVPGFA